MKSTRLLILIAMSFLLISGCSKEIEPPVIKNFELGYDNSKIAYAGDELHIDAEIFAEGKVDRIRLVIHHEGEHKSAILVFDEEWELDVTFTEFNGIKNVTFHKHFDIPEDAEAGHYHVYFSVVDMQGNQTEVEDEIEIKHNGSGHGH
jgi:hypothetical protein